MCGADGVQRVRGRPSQPGHQGQAERRHRQRQPRAARPRQPGQRRARQHQARGGHARDQHHPAQPRQPVWCSVEQDVRPHGAGQDAAGGRDPPGHRPGSGPCLPPGRRPDAYQGGDAGREGDHVVGVDDAVHVAEHQAGHQHPAPPQQCRGPRSVGPHRPARHPAHRGQRDQRRGQQPADLPAELGMEEPE